MKYILSFLILCSAFTAQSQYSYFITKVYDTVSVNLSDTTIKGVDFHRKAVKVMLVDNSDLRFVTVSGNVYHYTTEDSLFDAIKPVPFSLTATDNSYINGANGDYLGNNLAAIQETYGQYLADSGYWKYSIPVITEYSGLTQESKRTVVSLHDLMWGSMWRNKSGIEADVIKNWPK